MYNILFDKSAAKLFRKLEREIQERIAKKIEMLKENPFLGEPLIGNLAGMYKLRAGVYRIIYKIQQDKLIILILDIGHRRNIYK